MSPGGKEEAGKGEWGSGVVSKKQSHCIVGEESHYAIYMPIRFVFASRPSNINTRVTQ